MDIMNEILNLGAAELQRKIKERKIKSVEATRASLDRIKNADQRIRAFVSVNEKEALRKAEEVDGKISRNEPVGALAGVPIAIKDNINIEGLKTTCSSKILENYVAPYDATVIEKLKKADAVFIGKTNLDEFAMGSSTENSAFQTTKNPWNTDYISGGSSGGSAAAVSSAMVSLALGSDTGGSIRQPAACCGVCGLKPSYGRVSRYGLVAFASSLDQIGGFSNSVEDTALLMSVIAGYDPKDSTSVNLPVPDYLSELKKDIKGMKIGLPKEYFIDGTDKEVERSVKDAVKVFEKLGAKVSEITLPNTKYAISVYYLIATSEASANLARYDGIKYGLRVEGNTLIDEYEKTRGAGFGPEVKRRIMLGTYALSAGYYDAYYGKAQKVRTLIRRDFEDAFNKVDLIITPTSPTTAFKIGEKVRTLFRCICPIFSRYPATSRGFRGSPFPAGFQAPSFR